MNVDPARALDIEQHPGAKRLVAICQEFFAKVADLYAIKILPRAKRLYNDKDSRERSRGISQQELWTG